MVSKDRNNISFFGVGVLLVFFGAAIFSIGLVMWLFNYFGSTVFSAPSQKVIGGLMVLGLGYILLDLEFLRKK